MTDSTPRLTQTQRDLLRTIRQKQAQQKADRLHVRIGSYRMWFLDNHSGGNKESVYRALQHKGYITIHQAPGYITVAAVEESRTK